MHKIEIRADRASSAPTLRFNRDETQGKFRTAANQAKRVDKQQNGEKTLSERTNCLSFEETGQKWVPDVKAIGSPWKKDIVSSSAFIMFKDLFSETVWPFKAKFHVEPPLEGGTKVYINGSGHMTKMTQALKVNRLRTTIRMAQRFKERRRTEADLTIYKKPSVLLANEMIVRRMSQEELEMSLTRTCRPTASFLARTASNRRINARDIYVPPPYSQVKIFTVESGRFSGKRSLKEKELKNLITRLSTYNAKRLPAESKRLLTDETKRQLGSLGSYRWQGVRNY